ncbi:RNA polymerase factor sigma-54 [Enterococcus sp. HY326]|uniref:RNA polymerase factor sigma-54 n=1 Tax=Enterococcus sp. HY326 TaxID=2971265 RepID=UPI00223FE130|nr:RNA polymerase factor sigma-54 [Enterococcus sp. HY326]
MKFEQNFSQQQRQTQKLAMTQQLQQSLQVLQFNTEELVDYLDNMALENPLIEVIEPSFVADYGRGSGASQAGLDIINLVSQDRISLFEYLIQQIHLNYRDTFLRSLVLYLVEYIDLNGYLKISLEEAAEQTGAGAIELLDALTLIQQLEPAGVGARDLQECLMLQTERDDYAPALAYIILEENFEDLVARRWEKIAKKFAIELKDVQQIFDYLQTLTPSPGSGFSQETEQYVVPDLSVKVVEDQIKISSNRKGQPEIKFQEKYFLRMQAKADDETLAYLKGKQQEYQTMKKMMQQRGDTILRVGTVIAQVQQQFFLDDNRPLRPLTMKEVAEELEIHESTVSRSVNGKYLETDFGIFELKNFFTNRINDAGSDDQSADSAKQAIAQLVAEENKQKPLSDQKIVDLLKEKEIQISRRTVTKYREALGIQSSSKRKRFDA